MFKILLIFLTATMFSLSYPKNYNIEFSKFYINEKLIVNTTNRINFTAESVIYIDEANPNNFFHIELNNNNNFLNFTNIEINSTNSVKMGNNIYFKSSSNGAPLNKITFTIKGTAIFNWFYKNNNIENIKIGYINSNINPVFLNLKMEQFNPIQKLKIKVNKNMNLGKAPSGEKLSTRQGGTGTPADISVSGQIGKGVIIHIPESVDIRNSKNDSLNVKLMFRENRSNTLKKELIPNSNDITKEGNTGAATINHILIDGECQTKKNDFGKYQGTFTVRVEYED